MPLRSLASHFGTLTDVLALAVSASPITRAKQGQRDWTMSCYLADGSMLQGSKTNNLVVTANILRPHRSSLPQVQPSDSLILRNFKVSFFAKRISLISTDTSAWAVFQNKTGEPQVRGPPLEIGPEERAYARKTREWWQRLSVEQKQRFEDALPSRTSTPTNGNAPPTIKKEGIDGIGINLPGSLGSRRDTMKKAKLYSTQALAKEWATGVIRSSEPEASSGDEGPNITRRALRPRNARGKTKSMSPEKEDPPARRTRGAGTRGASTEIQDSQSEKESGRTGTGRGRRGKSAETEGAAPARRGGRGGRRGRARKFG